MTGKEDVLRARLKTIGVSEHRFTLKAGTPSVCDQGSAVLTG